MSGNGIVEDAAREGVGAEYAHSVADVGVDTHWVSESEVYHS